MSKIRINELARQLEVPSHEVLELLSELGVSEKKTHSSSIDDHVAELVRRHYHGDSSKPLYYGNGTTSETAQTSPESEPQLEDETPPSAPPTAIGMGSFPPLEAANVPEAQAPPATEPPSADPALARMEEAPRMRPAP